MHHHHHRDARDARALTPVPLRPRSCGKHWHGDRISADLALAQIRARGPALAKEPVRSYLCPGCGGWHLTSAPTWRSAHPFIPRPRTESSPMRSRQPVASR